MNGYNQPNNINVVHHRRSQKRVGNPYQHLATRSSSDIYGSVSNYNRVPPPPPPSRHIYGGSSTPQPIAKKKISNITSSQSTLTSSSYTSMNSIKQNINPLYSSNNRSPQSIHSADYSSEYDDYDVWSESSFGGYNNNNNNNEWIECKECESGKSIWYNRSTMMVSLSNPEYNAFELNNNNNNNSDDNDLFTKPIARQDISDNDITSFVLAFDKKEWDFNNDHVAVYRSQSAAIDHKLLCPHPNDLVFPEFFSNHTIPKTECFTAIILPPIDFNITSTSWKMTVNVAETTASDIISKFVSKINFNRSSSDEFYPSQFVLKVIGNEEYILFDDNKLIIDYEAVRRAVRNEDDVVFGLVHRPDLDQIIADARDLQQDYKETFDNKYPSPTFLKYECNGVGDGKSLIELKLESMDKNKQSLIESKCNYNIPSSFYRNNNKKEIKEIKSHHRLSVTEQEQRGHNTQSRGHKSPFGSEPSLSDSIWLQSEIRDRNRMGDYSAILLSDHNELYRFRINSLTNVTKLARFIASSSSSTPIRRVIVRHELWIGTLSYDSCRYTTPNIARVSDNMVFADWFESCDIFYCNLARETTISLTIYGLSQSKKNNKSVISTPLGFVRIPIIDHRHRLINGKYTFNIWPIPVFVQRKHGLKSDPYSADGHSFRFRGPTRDRYLKKKRKESSTALKHESSILDHFNKPTHDICQVQIEFRFNDFDVVAPLININNNVAAVNRDRKLTDSDWQNIHNIITRDLIEPINDGEKELMWCARNDLVSMPSALPTFLKCIDWRSPFERVETYKYLLLWEAPAYLEDALELLSWHYSDNRVREYGVMCIASMHDSDLQRYLLQLISCLKFELHHNNALIRLLMRRGLMNPYQIGHFLFWGLYAEYQDNAQYIERFGLYLEEYLLHSTSHSRELLQEINLVSHLKYINHKIYYGKNVEKRDSTDLLCELHSHCESLNNLLPSIISLPLNPRWRCTHLCVKKCKFFSSAQVPLFLVFKNVDPLANDICVLFKCGDDLRQDILTLQVLKVMDKVWLDRGLNLRLITYDVVATGNDSGMLEIVSYSTTTNDIHLRNNATAQKGCRDETTHLKWIKEYNKSADKLAAARKNYTRSVAGYCVATYVLGIGDRHPDNIMLRQNGVLFHIDFGHFLGNFKVKKVVANYKWRRERTPFVFLPAMKYVMKQQFEQFEQWFTDAYMALRIRNRLLFNLFILMIPSKMPELIQLNDLKYLRDQLHLNDIPQDKISKHCKKIIKQCLNDKSRILDNIFHAVKHM